MLVNITAFRLIVEFATSFTIATWIQDLGFLESFGLYSAALGVVSLALPAVYIYGKRMRAWWGGRLEPSVIKEVDDRVDHSKAGVGIAW